jgi:hypothetical protein
MPQVIPVDVDVCIYPFIHRYRGRNRMLLHQRRAVVNKPLQRRVPLGGRRTIVPSLPDAAFAVVPDVAPDIIRRAYIFVRLQAILVVERERPLSAIGQLRPAPRRIEFLRSSQVIVCIVSVRTCRIDRHIAVFRRAEIGELVTPRIRTRLGVRPAGIVVEFNLRRVAAEVVRRPFVLHHDHFLVGVVPLHDPLARHPPHPVEFVTRLVPNRRVLPRTLAKLRYASLVKSEKPALDYLSLIFNKKA